MVPVRLPLVACLAGLIALNPRGFAAEESAPAPTLDKTTIAELDSQQAALYIEAEAAYQQALARYRKAQFIEARAEVERAIRIFPGHVEAQQLRERVLAALSNRPDALQSTTNGLVDLKVVSAQEQAVRVAGLVKTGDDALATGDFRTAHRSYDQAAIAIRTFTYDYDWGDLPAQIQAKLVTAENAAREADLQAERDARQQAQQRQSELAAREEALLTAKVNEMLRRAGEAYDRRDFKRAGLLAWNAYEMDRRRDDARALWLRSQRNGHVQFDRWYEETRDEAIARVNENMHMALIPQTELLTYPSDWFRRSQRKPVELGANREEAWMQQIRDRLEQVVTVQFEEAELVDVVDFLRRTTGVNMVIGAEVFADAAVPPVTLAATNMKLKTVLRWVLQITRLNMAIKNEAIFISTQVGGGDAVLRLYDISDLLQPIQDFRGVELGYNAEDTGGFGLIDDLGSDTDADPQEMIDFIRSNVAPESWEEQGRSIQLMSGGTLFVSHTVDVHQQVQELLSELRNQQSLQVKVSIRLVEVRKGFFEEIGVEQPILQNVNSDQALFGAIDSTNGVGPAVTHELLISPRGGDVTVGAPAGLSLRHFANANDTLTGPQVEWLLTAMEQETDGQTLTSPELTCYNGQRANASFVRQVAYIRDYDIVVSGDDQGTPDPQIETINVGNIIDVRPIVSSDRKYITMEVRPASSELIEDGNREATINVFTDLAGTSVPLSLSVYLPKIRLRTMRSTIMLPDKGSVVVGGLTSARRERAESGIPFLAHIPFLGRLFSKTGMIDNNRQLFYIVSAEILNLAEREAQQ